MARHTDTPGALIAAAAGEFAQRGYHGAGIDRIAESAGINKRMIYHHFGDKAGLFAAVVKVHLGDWDGRPLDAGDVCLLLAEAEYLRAGGEAVDMQERAAALRGVFGGCHPGVSLATLGVQMLPALLPQLLELLGLDSERISAALPAQVRTALEKAQAKERITLQAASRANTSK